MIRQTNLIESFHCTSHNLLPSHPAKLHEPDAKVEIRSPRHERDNFDILARNQLKVNGWKGEGIKMSDESSQTKYH